MKNIEETINDLHLLAESFKEESGAIPICLLDSIELIMALKTLKEALK